MIIILFVVYSALFIVLASLPIWIGYDSWVGRRSGVIWKERADTPRAAEGAEELPTAPLALRRT